jgi:hypothetical protein
MFISSVVYWNEQTVGGHHAGQDDQQQRAYHLAEGDCHDRAIAALAKDDIDQQRHHDGDRDRQDHAHGGWRYLPMPREEQPQHVQRGIHADQERVEGEDLRDW